MKCDVDTAEETELVSLPHCHSPQVQVNDFFSIYLILPTALGPGVYSASNRNEYQENGVPRE
jgi:hypothetical protein